MNSVKFKKHILQIPIIQGGMGVGVSLENLAGHVAKCGGMGVISSAHAGYRETDFEEHPAEATRVAIPKIIKKARAISEQHGLIAINIMVAIEDYVNHVKAAVEAGVDAIISGAGLPMQLPELVKTSDVMIAPIVSSGKVANLICKAWDKRYNRIPDFIIVEGSEAGGHLGFKSDDVIGGITESLEKILADVLEAIKPYQDKFQYQIPIFVAGGIFTKTDIEKYLQLGASGVQMGTRFIATEECDADPAFKNAIVQATAEDVVVVKSPVGMPGRALFSPLIARLQKVDKVPVSKCYRCLKPCDPGTTPYCITQALIAAVKGDWENGLFFSGSSAVRIHEICSVRALMTELSGQGCV